MILQFNQVSRQPNPLFEGRINDEVVIAGKGATRTEDGFVAYHGRKYAISGCPHRDQIKGERVTQVIDALLAEKRVGYVYPDLVEQKRVLIISFGYDYFVYRFEGVDYTVYEVGLGKD